MVDKRNTRAVLVVFTALIGSLLLPGMVEAAKAKEYGYAVISGQLRDPEKKGPMVGATIRLIEAQDMDEDLPLEQLGTLQVSEESVYDSKGSPVIRKGLSTTYEAITDEDGQFVFSRLPLDRRWRLEILMISGEVIRATSLVEISSGRAELKLAITKRLDRAAEVDTDAPGTRWVIPGVQPPKWKRFWKQFGIFMAGAVVLAL